MGITGKLFLGSLGLTALLACGLTVWLWPRLAGPGARAFAGRLSMLLVSQLSVLLVFLTLANAVFGFYTSWGDLFGTASRQYHLTSAGGVPLDSDAAQLHDGVGAAPASTSPGGVVLTATLVGLRSGITADLRVFLPPQYFQPGPHHYYPAIVVDANAAPDIAQLATEIQHSPHRRPAVIVIVDGVDGRNIPCTADQPGGPAGMLFWGQDLRTAIAARFRVHLNAASWGALSSGPDGDCAASLALRDANRYSAAVVLGPWPHHGLPNTPADPAWWLRNYPSPPVRLLFSGLGQSPTSLLGPVNPPLQVTTAPALTEYGAVDWLAQALQNGALT